MFRRLLRLRRSYILVKLFALWAQDTILIIIVGTVFYIFSVRFWVQFNVGLLEKLEYNYSAVLTLYDRSFS